MSDELISSLKSQVADLKRDNQTLLSESIKRKQSNQELRKQLASTQATLTTTTAERDDYKTKATTQPPNEIAEELAKTKVELRTLKHRDGLKQLAYSAEVGINPNVPVDRIMKLAEYIPETDEFDAKGAKVKLLALRTTDAYLFQPGGESTQEGSAPGGAGSDQAALNPEIETMVGALGRGSGHAAASAGSRPTQGQLQDPRGMREWSETRKVLAGRR